MSDRHVLESVLKHPHSLSETQKNAILNHGDERVKQLGLSSLPLSHEHFYKMLNNPSTSLNHVIAIRKNPNLHSDIIDKSIATGYRAGLHENPSLTSEQIDKLYHHATASIENKHTLLKNKNASPGVLDAAMKTKHHSYFREAAIEHPNHTEDHYNKAKEDDDDFVRFSAMKSPFAKKEDMEKTITHFDNNRWQDGKDRVSDLMKAKFPNE